MIKHSDKPNTTIIYSKNACQKCMMTKRILKSKGVPFEEINIQDGNEFDDYVEYLKSEVDGSAMPFVFPAVETGVEPWSDFRNDKINELVAKVKG